MDVNREFGRTKSSARDSSGELSVEGEETRRPVEKSVGRVKGEKKNSGWSGGRGRRSPRDDVWVR